jgi:hypothetical protein
MRLDLRVSRAFVAVALALAGCAAPRPLVADDYDPGGAPREQFERGAALCDKQAVADQKNIGLGPYDPTYSTQNRMFDACMRASGYTLKPKP